MSSNDISVEDINKIFTRASLFKREYESKGRIDHLVNQGSLGQKVITLIFSEPSTRTRTSFQMAALRLGLRVVSLDNMAVSSMKKGETIADTLRNVAAMWPDIIVARFNDDIESYDVVKNSKIPVINAGIGTHEHPTQALLDAFTILDSRGQIEGEKVLIVGDVLHSRVANSNLILLRKLGAEIAYCAPIEFQPKNDDWADVRQFPDRDEAVKWASVIMGLRIQKERHMGAAGSIALTVAAYRDKYRIGGDQLNHFQQDGILLHPGPVNRGVEFSNYVLSDSRCKVLNQVTNGVFVRASLLSFTLGLEVKEA
ncbi:MAG: aspartate carbamoyltransferase catalytic subunit [Bdellovibrionales bacterium]|nr:aspartate carbamoyltransferase catalytic subunit [Bdellovibrionales bacterium]